MVHDPRDPDSPAPEAPTADLADDPAELLRHLIRFDTANPPGNERACIEWLADLLADAGVDPDLYATDPDRPNLVARLPGDDAPSLMCYGHVDVVPVEGQEWSHPPFAGVVEDGCVWGRGALDMKAGVAMFVSAFVRAARRDLDLAGDLLLVVLPDEEAGGTVGAKYIVEEHPDLFEDVEMALGEFGGFPMELVGERFYPIQVNEKQLCPIEVTFTGPAGHGSLPQSGGAMAKMARFVDELDGRRLPVHVTPTFERMVAAIAAELDGEAADRLEGLLDPAKTDAVLEDLPNAEFFDAAAHNTANPTVVRGGSKDNVVPGEVELTIDCRLLPGFGPEDALAELGEVAADAGVEDAEIRVEGFQEGPEESDMAGFELLAGVLETADEEATAVPLLLSGVTDGRHFADVGVQTYGFTPMNLPAEMEFIPLIHAADERIPVESVAFGADAVFEALRRYEG